MLVAVDLDNTIDTNPKEFQSLTTALRAAGHVVVILTGTTEHAVTQDVWRRKAEYLQELGCSECWDEMTVLANLADPDYPNRKGVWCKEHGVDILIDNSKTNAKAATAAGVPLVFVPWATRSD